MCYHPAMSAEGAARFTCYARFVSVDPTRNRARFYALTWQPALWGGGALIRAWGRLPGPGRALTRFCPDRASTQPEGSPSASATATPSPPGSAPDRRGGRAPGAKPREGACQRPDSARIRRPNCPSNTS